jgi:thiol-disulfide isomerase/thioredoxin
MKSLREKLQRTLCHSFPALLFCSILFAGVAGEPARAEVEIPAAIKSDKATLKLPPLDENAPAELIDLSERQPPAPQALRLSRPAPVEPALKVGDSAPKLQVGSWVQGKPVEGFEAGKAYLVEFWATWCGPCITSIPHLDALHRKFKDRGLVVIGQNVWEHDESLVEPFVRKMGEKMTYRVALDDKSQQSKGAMAVTWMEAADRKGIPVAFLVNREGRIVWVGHPMALEEHTIESLLAEAIQNQE